MFWTIITRTVIILLSISHVFVPLGNIQEDGGISVFYWYFFWGAETADKHSSQFIQRSCFHLQLCILTVFWSRRKPPQSSVKTLFTELRTFFWFCHFHLLFLMWYVEMCIKWHLWKRGYWTLLWGFITNVFYNCKTSDSVHYASRSQICPKQISPNSCCCCHLLFFVMCLCW